MMETHYVYILTNKKSGVLYIGMTHDLHKRMWQHKNKALIGFATKYNLTRLTHFETFDDKWSAANRERQLKNWRRQWKIELIEKSNPKWLDLYEQLLGDPDCRQDANVFL